MLYSRREEGLHSPLDAATAKNHLRAPLQVSAEMVIESQPLHPCESIITPVGPFLDRATRFLLQRTAIPIRDCEIDHICYRTSTKGEYQRVVRALLEHGEMLVEGMIGGRPIATIALHQPLVYDCWSIRCIEVPCPKPGRAYASGLEHLEVVIAGLLLKAERGTPYHSRPLLELFMGRFGQSLPFDTRAVDKEVNADVSLSISADCSVKFHVCGLFEVATLEKAQGLVEEVPVGYFDGVA